MTSLTGRVALVTGSSRGIGAAVATHFARAGARVVLHGRDKAALDRLRTAIVDSGKSKPPGAGQHRAHPPTGVKVLGFGIAAPIGERDPGGPGRGGGYAGIRRRSTGSAPPPPPMSTRC